MSKLNIDNLKKAIQATVDGAKEKPRKFLETVELQIGLKDYDTQRDKRFAGTIKLPYVPRPRMKVCVIGDAAHCEMAQRSGLPFKSVEDNTANHNTITISINRIITICSSSYCMILCVYIYIYIYTCILHYA